MLILKIIKRIFGVLLCLYVLFISAVFYVFHDAEKYHVSIEKMLSYYSQQSVKIAEFKTLWINYQPAILLKDISITEHGSNKLHAEVDQVALKLDLSSIFLLWPVINEFAVYQPRVTIESIADGSFRLAGKKYTPSKSQQRRSILSLIWLASQKKADIYNGELTWKHREGKTSYIQKFSAQFRREGAHRELHAVAQHDSDVLGLFLKVDGNAILSHKWDAQIKLLSGNHVRQMNKVNIDGYVEQGKGKLVASNLRLQRLADMVNIFGQGGKLSQWLNASQIQGELHDMQIDFDGALFRLDAWQLSAKGHKLGWLGTNNAPGIDSLDAIFRINQSEGVFAFLGKNSTVSWPKVFLQPVGVDHMAAEVTFIRRSGKWSMELRDGSFINKDLQLRQLHSSLTEKLEQPYHLVFKTKFNTNDAAQLEKYLPKQTSLKFRNWWQNAIGKNTAIEGDISYVGNVSDEALKKGQANMSAKLIASNVSLDYGYQRGWPVLMTDKLTVQLDNGNLAMSSDTGKIGSFDARNITVGIEEIFNIDRNIEFDSALSGSSESLIRFLADGPLNRNKKNQSIRYASSAGHFSGNVKATIPLKKVKKTSVEGSLELFATQLSIGKNIDIDDINGKLNFTERRYSAENVKASLFGGPVTANIVTTESGRPPKWRMDLAGQADFAKLDKLIGKQLASRLAGRSAWNAKLNFSKQGLALDLTSQLDGVAIDLPKPVSKKQTSQVPLVVSFIDGPDRQKKLQVELGRDLSVQLQSATQKGGKLVDQGVIGIGRFNKADLAIASKAQGITIIAKNKAINLDDWRSALVTMTKTTPKTNDKRGFVDQLRRITIDAEELRLFEKPFGQSDIDLTSIDGNDWQLVINSDVAKGQGVLQFDDNKYQLDLDKLHWPVKQKEADEGQQRDKENKIRKKRPAPDTFPEVLIKAKEFRTTKQQFGSLYFQAKPTDAAWMIEKLKVGDERYSIEGTGEWRGEKTTLNTKITAKAGGESLNDFDLGNFLDGGKVALTANLNWSGAPMDFALSEARGNYKLEIKQGAFPRVNADRGRLFGVLNVNTVSRRLRLDFGDIFGSGLVFDELKSTGEIMTGKIILDQFYIFSPSVFVESQGKVDFDNESYDLQLKVSPQLGGNIALLTALSNPAAGAFVWIVDRMFKGKLNQVVVYTYTVQGPWDKPIIERSSNQKQEKVAEKETTQSQLPRN